QRADAADRSASAAVPVLQLSDQSTGPEAQQDVPLRKPQVPGERGRVQHREWQLRVVDQQQLRIDRSDVAAPDVDVRRSVVQIRRSVRLLMNWPLSTQRSPRTHVLGGFGELRGALPSNRSLIPKNGQVMTLPETRNHEITKNQ